VNAASKYLDHQNAVLGRQVLLSVKLIRVALNRQADSGIDFGLAFKNFVNGAATWGLGSSAGSSIASNLGGNLTYTVLDSTRSTAGSTMVAKFVSDFGQIVDEYSQDIPVRNNRTVPLMDYTSQSYLSKTTPGSGENGVPGLETSTILSGTLFSITPSIKDNESLVLSLGLDRTNDPILTSISTGEGRTFQQVQLVNQRGIKLDTEIGIKNRETLIIMGINKDSYSDDNRWGISGVSKALSGNRELQFIIISPRIISGS
jgi:type II secretory pathway component GspD/PulD (secretin)